MQHICYPVYGEDAYALMGCLKEDAEKVVRDVEDDYRKMFQRLDEKYGCEEKLVDSVMGELKELSGIQDGDIVGFELQGRNSKSLNLRYMHWREVKVTVSI